ncbi:MAG: ABC transporter permease [Fulvivirga sp.]
MIRNYVLIAFRNFRKERLFSLLNLAGLSLGITATLLIVQYVKYERSFDAFHSRADDIYRIQYNGWQNGQISFESAVSVPMSAAALKENFSEVEQFTRFLPTSGIISYEKPGETPISFREERAFFADTSLFRVFDFDLLVGDTKSTLKGTNKVVISQTSAVKYFRDEDPIGKQLALDGNDAMLEVTGVFQDVPENSHIKFDFLISYETINAWTNNGSETSWGWYDFYSFVLLKPGTDVSDLQTKWDNYLVENRRQAWESRNSKQEFILRPLKDIHLYSNLLYETSPQELRDGDSINALSLIAIFIMFIAWVNYVNLATARSIKRANEVGVRKVVGATRKQLISQFLTESFIINFLATLFALAAVRISWESFSSLTGWNIPLDFFTNSEFWVKVGILFIFGTFFSGFYPAIVLSSFKPISVLKGKLISSTGGKYLRKGLVVFQFIASVFLIGGSIIVYQQLDYMRNLDLGVDIKETLVLKAPGVVDSLYSSNYESFKTEALRIPGVESISASSSIPGEENYWTNAIGRISGGPEGRTTVTNMAIDYEHVTQFDIGVVAGRNFDREFMTENDKVLINESLMKVLQFDNAESAIGEFVANGGDTLQIIGVLEDYHQMSLKAEVIPVVFRMNTLGSFYSLKLETKNYSQVIAALDEPWSTFFPGNPLDYFFLDQFFNRQYDNDDRFSKVFTLFTGLAIFIASLGLLGLASFMTLQRTREIGIRKVLGSTVSGIVILLSKEFLQPVFIAIILACPLGWWLMNYWLESFPYRIDVGVMVFVISAVMVLLIAFSSVFSQTVKAALTKPSETLKYE